MKAILQSIINIAKPFMGMAGTQAHAAIDRVITVPKADRLKLCAGMTDEEIAHAEGLYSKHVDATSDYIAYVASRGAIEED